MNDHLCGLDTLEPGSSGMVSVLPQDVEKRRRLMALGLVCGTKITAVHTAPFGDPKAYFFRGTVIALRRSDAENILISPYTEQV